VIVLVIVEKFYTMQARDKNNLLRFFRNTDFFYRGKGPAGKEPRGDDNVEEIIQEQLSDFLLVNSINC